ncbi:unnamed protein product [Coregonus sp. 'balchen']|nr:unnamed protein product [Coregonus sp. 'balchen']
MSEDCLMPLELEGMSMPVGGAPGSNIKMRDADKTSQASKPVRDPLLQLISLQKASGSWVLEAALAEVLGKTEEEVAKPKPAQVASLSSASFLSLSLSLCLSICLSLALSPSLSLSQVDHEVWATVLALVWLYGFKMEAQEEWQFLAMKAASWIQAQKVASVSECVQTGNNLLGCQVQKDTLGL